MKRLSIIFMLAVLTLSCENELLVHDSEVPGWLKDRIANDEALIEASPQSGLDMAAWIRYRYDGSYYFEYYNVLSSSFPNIYNEGGIKVMSGYEEYQAFSSGRCCKTYVWKGKSYIEIDDK